MTSINLDLSKLLGFRILDTTEATGASLGMKSGDKPTVSANAGNKVGTKLGEKLGAKDGLKEA